MAAGRKFKYFIILRNRKVWIFEQRIVSVKVTVYADNNPSNIFADIKYGTWQYDAALPVFEAGYMTGKGNLGSRVLFSPNTDIKNTRKIKGENIAEKKKNKKLTRTLDICWTMAYKITS